VHLVIIQDEGSSLKATAAWAGAAAVMMKAASSETRTAIDVSELILGTECGGSDACSGISANPALGVARDQFIEAGGIVMLAETTEIIGAEHRIAARP
jgi:altronate dehydratase large subunit